MQGTLRNENGEVVCDRCTVAHNTYSRMVGLLGRSGLPEGEGLLLQPAGSIHTFFMRFPIDAVFVGKPSGEGGDRVVVSVHPALPTWRGLVPLVRGAHGVLELPVGTIAATGTVVGDRIALEGQAG